MAIFFHKHTLNKLKFTVCFFFIFLFQENFSQNASVLENITESVGLPSNYIFNANEDQNGIIWLGTDKGLATYQDGKWVTLDKDNGMPGNYIKRAIADGKNGLLLSISECGMYFFDTNKRIITVKYPNFKDKTFIDFKKSSYQNDYIIFHYLGKKNNESIFFAVHNSNIKKLYPLKVIGNQVFFVYNDKRIILENLSTLEKPSKIKFKKYDLEIINEGVLVSENGKSVDTLTEKNGLGNNYVNQIFKTKKEDVIISTIGGGISILRKNNAKISFAINTTNTRSIQTYQGKKYILSDGFLYAINKSKIEFKIFLKKDALTFLISQGKLYLGSFSGLDIYQINQNKIKLIQSYPKTVGISKIFKIGEKIIFTTYGTGIFVIEKNKISNYNNKPFNNIENFSKIKNGYAMISYESGVSLLDENFKFLKNISKKDGLISNFVNCVFSDNDTLYVGTRKGFTVFYNDKIVFNSKKENGFLGNVTKSIFRDIKNKIWILTDKGLLLKSKNAVRTIGSLRFLENEQDIILKGDYSAIDHNILVVTKNKISEINLDKIIVNRVVKPVFLMNIYEDGKIINHNKNITFEDHNKNVNFIFSSVDKDILGNTTLYFKVNDDIWKPFKESRELKFSHLDRGKYKIQIKSVNEDGYESIMPKVIEFKVLGPFYIRWWFILISTSIVAVFLYNYINEVNKKKYVKRLNQLRIKHQLENERKRISRDLHDNIGAYVTSLISKIDKLKVTNLNSNSSDITCDDVRLDAEHILALLRQTIWVLANKETNVIALYDNYKSYASKFLKSDNIRIIFEENIENNRKFDSTIGSSIFRIMQEALQNIYKHANATKIEVNIISKEKIIIYIKDNGKGFNQENMIEGYGIKNMKERARELGFQFNIYSDSTGTILELFEI